LHFKLREGASDEERRKVIEALRERGASKVDPLFPGEQDASLSDVFAVSGPDHIEATDLLDVLKESKAVDFAEVAPVRKPL
jgi:hypothetical protein